MKITIDFGGGIERIYELGAEASASICKGEMLRIETRHPSHSETCIIGIGEDGEKERLKSELHTQTRFIENALKEKWATIKKGKGEKK